MKASMLTKSKSHFRSAALGVAFAVFTATAASGGAWSVTKVSEYTFSGNAANVTGLSGITWAGGDKFYVVNDGGDGTTGYLYPATIGINYSSGAVTSLAIDTQNATAFTEKISGQAYDAEGVAYDPALNEVYISNETGPKIMAYVPGSSSSTCTVAPGETTNENSLKALYSGQRGNLSLESLTISGDGKTMWTCNEEALDNGIDGAKASGSNGTIVRLTKFTRDNILTRDWSYAGQWAYKTRSVSGTIIKEDKNGRGVSDLALLPDGTLLVLERECALHGLNPSSKFIIIGIYAISPDKLTDNSGHKITGTTLNPITNAEQLFTENTDMANYEGMCIGPSINGGTSLLLVSDGDQTGGYAFTKKIYALKLTHSSQKIVTVQNEVNILNNSQNVNEEIVRTRVKPSMPGGPYRFMSGTTVSGLSCDINDNLAASYMKFVGLTAYGANSVNASSITLGTSDVTVNWNIDVVNAGTGLLGDHFEQYAPETLMDNLHGWTGEGVIKTASYAAPSAGYPLPNAAHTKVLNVPGDDAVRSYAFPGGTSGTEIDMMICPTWLTTTPTALEGNDMQVALCVAADGAIMIYHASADGSANQWTRIPNIQLANKGDWARVTMKFKYPANDQSVSFAQVRVNGKLCVAQSGLSLPATSASANGSWFRTPSGARKVQSLTISGVGSVDDVVATDDLSLRHRGGVQVLFK